jgi:hypothetical protein
MRAMRTVGVPYTDGEIETAVADMARQAKAITADVEAQKGPTGLADKEITALTAYLQRLGTDIRWKKPDVAPAVAPASAASGTSAGAPTSAPASVPTGTQAGALAGKMAGQAPAVR